MGGIFGGGGGGGSTSSGGSSSNSQLEQYIQDAHELVLNAVWDNITTGENPYTSINPFNPDTYLDGLFSALASFAQTLIDFDDANIDKDALTTGLSTQLAQIDSLTPMSNWSTYFSQIDGIIPDMGLTDAEILEGVQAIEDITLDELETKVIPTFEAGMRDINAVNSSFFTIGEALLYSQAAKHIANAVATYKLETSKAAVERAKLIVTSTDFILNAMFTKINAYGTYSAELTKIFITGVGMKQALTAMTSDAVRAAANIQKTYVDEANRIDVAENRWYLDKYAYQGNILASVRGAIHSTSSGQQQSQVGSSDIGAIFSGVGAGLGIAAMFSDIRLKSNIRRIGTHKYGVGVYEYDIFGRREVGVIAQELMMIRPDLVLVGPGNYLMVNYAGL